MIVDDLKKSILKEAFTNGFNNCDYQIKKIEDIFNIINGFTPLRSDSTLWSDDEINWFTVDDYNAQGMFINYTKQHISSKAIGNNSNRVLPAGTVILCCTSATIGTSAICNVPMATNQQFNGLVPKDGIIVDTKFLYYYTLTLKYKMKSNSTSTTFPFLSVKNLGKYEFPYIDIKFQKQIVEKIEKIFNKLDEIKPLEVELSSLKSSFSANIKKSILSAVYKDLEDVSKVRLAEIVTFENIKNASLGLYTYLDVKYLRTANDGKKVDCGKYISKGDLAILMDGENSGELFKIPEDGYLGSTLKKISLNSDILEKYFIYYLELKKDYFKGNKRGAAIPHLDKKIFNESKIYFPPKEEQQKIVDKIEQLLPLCNDIKHLIDG